MTKYGLIVSCKEVRGLRGAGDILVENGDEFLVTVDDEGWVPATSVSLRIEDTLKLPPKTKAFDNVEDARSFAEMWRGHPWWVQPNGSYRIIELTPVYETLTGYAVGECVAGVVSSEAVLGESSESSAAPKAVRQGKTLN
jgi:hypothetical protein